MARDDHLPRRVEIDGRHLFQAIGVRHGPGLVAGSLHVGVGQAQNGGHAAGTDRNGLLHGLGTQAHQTDGRIDVERTGSDQGGVLAQAVPSHEGRLGAAFRTPGSQAGHAGQQHGGLCPGSQGQFLGGAFGDDLRQGRFAQCGVGTTDEIIDFGTAGQRGQHADGLRALAGKDECNAHGLVLRTSG